MTGQEGASRSVVEEEFRDVVNSDDMGPYRPLKGLLLLL